MKTAELKEKTEKELEQTVADAREHVRASRFKVAFKQLKNVRDIRMQKHAIARALTLLKSRKSS